MFILSDQAGAESIQAQTPSLLILNKPWLQWRLTVNVVVKMVVQYMKGPWYALEVKEAASAMATVAAPCHALRVVGGWFEEQLRG